MICDAPELSDEVMRCSRSGVSSVWRRLKRIAFSSAADSMRADGGRLKPVASTDDADDCAVGCVAVSMSILLSVVVIGILVFEFGHKPVQYQQHREVGKTERYHSYRQREDMAQPSASEVAEEQ